MIALWILQATFSLVSTVNRVQKVTELHEIQPERISAQIVQQTISAASVPDQSPHCMEVTYGSCVSVSLSCLACLYFSISVIAQPSQFQTSLPSEKMQRLSCQNDTMDSRVLHYPQCSMPECGGQAHLCR